jgi:hypothetical protein
VRAALAAPAPKESPWHGKPCGFLCANESETPPVCKIKQGRLQSSFPKYGRSILDLIIRPHFAEKKSFLQVNNHPAKLNPKERRLPLEKQRSLDD